MKHENLKMIETETEIPEKRKKLKSIGGWSVLISE